MITHYFEFEFRCLVFEEKQGDFQSVTTNLHKIFPLVVLRNFRRIVFTTFLLLFSFNISSLWDSSVHSSFILNVILCFWQQKILKLKSKSGSRNADNYFLMFSLLLFHSHSRKNISRRCRNSHQCRRSHSKSSSRVQLCRPVPSRLSYCRSPYCFRGDVVHYQRLWTWRRAYVFLRIF